MAATGRRTVPSLKEALFAKGYEFEFFQAVRLLARIFAQRKQVGSTGRPKDEFVRFAQLGSCPDVNQSFLSMAFPASSVHSVDQSVVPGFPTSMTVTFFGLTGTQGVLPLWYTEWMIARRVAKDDTYAAFLDLFNHRLISLFYRAWEKHKPAGSLRTRRGPAARSRPVHAIAFRFHRHGHRRPSRTHGNSGRGSLALCRPDRTAPGSRNFSARHIARLLFRAGRNPAVHRSLVRIGRCGSLLSVAGIGAQPARRSRISR